MREIPQSLVEQLVQLKPISIVVTGSVASGEETPLSDVEIAVIFWWLQNNARTIWGEQVLEQLEVRMARDDWKEVLAFERGVALSAMIALRNGDRAGAEWGFSKSCLFGTLAGIALRDKEATSYQEIVQLGGIEFPDFRGLIERAGQVRQGSVTIKEEDIFQNLDYLYRLSRD